MQYKSHLRRNKMRWIPWNDAIMLFARETFYSNSDAIWRNSRHSCCDTNHLQCQDDSLRWQERLLHRATSPLQFSMSFVQVAISLQLWCNTISQIISLITSYTIMTMRQMCYFSLPSSIYSNHYLALKGKKKSMCPCWFDQTLVSPGSHYLWEVLGEV